ncbi:unnamed protein product [Calypogeia fissa]
MGPGKFVTLVGITILAVWGMRNGEFIYEGCQVPLDDGRRCALGVSARRNRLRYPGTQKQPNARARDGHLCAPIGGGIAMYSFFVQLDDEVIEVWEEAGTCLFGMTGLEFSKHCVSAESKKKCCRQAMEKTWTLTVWRPEKGSSRNIARAISFSEMIMRTPSRENAEAKGIPDLVAEFAKVEIKTDDAGHSGKSKDGGGVSIGQMPCRFQ